MSSRRGHAFSKRQAFPHSSARGRHITDVASRQRKRANDRNTFVQRRGLAEAFERLLQPLHGVRRFTLANVAHASKRSAHA